MECREGCLGAASRQADPRHRDLPHPRRGRQNDHQHRPPRRLLCHRQEGDRVLKGAVDGPRLRHEGRCNRRRLRTTHPHGGHQPPLHRRHGRSHPSAQPPRRADRQLPPAGQPTRPGSAHDHVGACARPQRSRTPRRRHRSGRAAQRCAAGIALRHHRRVGADGDPLPRRVDR